MNVWWVNRWMGGWLDLESHRPVKCDILALCPSTPRESSLPQERPMRCPTCCLPVCWIGILDLNALCQLAWQHEASSPSLTVPRWHSELSGHCIPWLLISSSRMGDTFLGTSWVSWVQAAGSL